MAPAGGWPSSSLKRARGPRAHGPSGAVPAGGLAVFENGVHPTNPLHRTPSRAIVRPRPGAGLVAKVTKTLVPSSAAHDSAPGPVRRRYEAPGRLRPGPGLPNPGISPPLGGSGMVDL